MLFTYHKYRKSVDGSEGDTGHPIYTGLHRDADASFELRERERYPRAGTPINDDHGRGPDKAEQVRISNLLPPSRYFWLVGTVVALAPISKYEPSRYHLPSGALEGEHCHCLRRQGDARPSSGCASFWWASHLVEVKKSSYDDFVFDVLRRELLMKS